MAHQQRLKKGAFIRGMSLTFTRMQPRKVYYITFCKEKKQRESRLFLGLENGKKRDSLQKRKMRGGNATTECSRQQWRKCSNEKKEGNASNKVRGNYSETEPFGLSCTSPWMIYGINSSQNIEHQVLFTLKRVIISR